MPPNPRKQVAPSATETAAEVTSPEELGSPSHKAESLMRELPSLLRANDSPDAIRRLLAIVDQSGKWLWGAELMTALDGIANVPAHIVADALVCRAKLMERLP